MSGVNAQAIFAAVSVGGTQDSLSKGQTPLRRECFWPVPWAQKLAAKAGCTAGKAMFVANLQAVELAQLCDHQVRKDQFR